MKVCVRLAKISKQITIEDENIDTTTVSDILEKVRAVFPAIEKQSFQLSLNKKDAVGDNDAKIPDIGIVSGDLIYVIGVDPEITGGSNVSLAQPREPAQLNEYTESGNGLTGFQQKSNSEICSGMSEFCSAEKTDKQLEMMETSVSDDTKDVKLLAQKLVWEPRLCRDSTGDRVPFMLEEVYTGLDARNACDALVVVNHVLMLEMGFTTKDTQQGEKSGADDSRRSSLCQRWKCMGCYKILYTHTGCEELQCCVTFVPMGSTLVVHGFVTDANNNQQHQIQVKVTDYVRYSLGTTDIAKCYRNLPELSRLFKDAIGFPLLQDLRSAKGLFNTDGLLGLVHEVKLQILSYLDLKSIVSVSEVCRELNTLSRDPYIWRSLYIQDFDSPGRRNALTQDWYELYKSKFRIEQERREAFRHMTFVTPHIGIPGRPNPPFPWVPIGPGVIGGDYDLNPDIHGIRDPLIRGNRRNNPGGPLAPNPRIDPLGPLPNMGGIPGRGGGLFDNRRMNRQPRFF